MRISTSWQHQLGVNSMLDQQAKMSATQLKLANDKKYLTPSENPVATTGLINLEQTIKENQQYQVNIGSARQRLSLEESSLRSATDILQSIRELAVRGMNGSLNPENRQQVATEIDELNKQLMSVANTQNANGEFIFSGYKSDQRTYTSSLTPPDTMPTYGYQGDINQRSVAIGPNRQVADGDSGEAVFGVVTGGGGAAGSIDNIFEAVSQLASDLRNNTPNSASLADIDRTMVRINTTDASVGARLKVLDSQENINAESILDHQTTASALGDLDYAEALSKFNQQQVALQAAQQTFTKVQGLSLFNYL